MQDISSGKLSNFRKIIQISNIYLSVNVGSGNKTLFLFTPICVHIIWHQKLLLAFDICDVYARLKYLTKKEGKLEASQLRGEILNDFANEIWKHEKSINSEENVNKYVELKKEQKKKITEMLFGLPQKSHNVAIQDASLPYKVQNGRCLLLPFTKIWSSEKKSAYIEEAISSIRVTYEDLNFKVDVRPNLTHSELRKLMGTLPQEYGDADCLVLYVFTHFEGQCK